MEGMRSAAHILGILHFAGSGVLLVSPRAFDAVH